jgi:hypothetical protein
LRQHFGKLDVLKDAGGTPDAPSQIIGKCGGGRLYETRLYLSFFKLGHCGTIASNGYRSTTSTACRRRKIYLCDIGELAAAAARANTITQLAAIPEPATSPTKCCTRRCDTIA